MGAPQKGINFPGYKFFWRHNISAVLWALLILALCGIPRSAVPKTNLIGVDKVVHFGLYAVFSLILMVGFLKQQQYRWLREKALYMAIGTGIVYGIIIELLQGTVFASRSAEPMDMVANAVGAVFGIVCFYFIYGKPKD